MVVKWTRESLKGTTKTQGDFNLAHKFTVEIDGVMVGGVHTIEGLEHEHEVVEYHDGDELIAFERGEAHRPGRQKPGRITIEKDWSSTKEFFNWRKAVVDGKTERKSISIVFHTDAGEEKRYNFFDCFPTEYFEPSPDAKNSGHAIEKIEISYADMSIDPQVV